MNTLKRDFLKSLLLNTPDNGIVCAPFLLKQGFSYENIKQYLRHGYLDSIGRGAYCKHGNQPPVASALNALNEQLDIALHLGGRSALARRGFLHFVPMQEMKVTLFGSSDEKLPSWFKRYYHERCECRMTGIFNDEAGVDSVEWEGFNVRASAPERAILEFISGVPRNCQLNEVYQIMEMMNTLRPKLLTQLLEKCSSIQTKRLFLLLAEDIRHGWYDRLDLANVDLGSGCRVVDAGGQYNSKWQVVVKPWKEI